MAAGETTTMSLAALRRHVGLLQTDVAERMGMTQSEVSRLERRDDLKLSTIAAYVEALGGDLQLQVRFQSERIDEVIVTHPGAEET